MLDQRLRDQQFYTRSLIEAGIDALMTTDPEGIISDVNKQMEWLTGCTRDELIGAPFNSHFTDPLLADECIALVLGEKTLSNYELTARSRDGSQTVVSINASTFYDRNRKLQGVVAAARDVTERKRLDKVLVEKNSELEVARRAAEGANRAKTDFLANMSHEIRSPLNAILGLSYLLEKTSLPLDTRSMVQNITASGRTLLRLISDILDVSKIEAGQIEIESEPFRLADILEKVSATLALAVGDKHIEWLVATPPDRVSILLGDALRLEQVLNNLCINASKFTECGRIDVRVELLAADAAPTMLRFSVSDTGIGIAPELQGPVFAAFTQADSSITRRFGGTGLGLTICRQLVGLMGGEIGVHSTLGVGSEFWFTLPLQGGLDGDMPDTDARALAIGESVPPGTALALPVGPSDALAGVRILVVDDSAINLDVAGRILMGQGALVSFASNGQQAMDWLLAHADAVDLVLMDVQMQVMDGMEATRRLRRLPQFDDLPIVALTAGAFKSQHAEAKAAGMTHIVNKPFNVPATIALIQRLRRRPGTAAAKEARAAAIVSFAEVPQALVAGAAAAPKEVARALLVTQLPLLMAALDSDNPAPAKPLLAAMEPVFPPTALEAIWACVRNYDFRGAEACTLQLASAYGVPYEGVNCETGIRTNRPCPGRRPFVQGAGQPPQAGRCRPAF